MKIVKGDLIAMAKAGEFNMIAHGCNCFCVMGAGIAKQIKESFPEAYEADLNTLQDYEYKLGDCSSAWNEEHKLMIVNLYTQLSTGPGLQLSYEALHQSLLRLGNDVRLIQQFQGKVKLGLPMIGCGLAGGDWACVKPIMEDALEGIDYTVVIYEPS